MSRAFPLSPHHYIQFLARDPNAPQVERGAWTQEIRTPYRYGTGVLYRVLGVGVLLGTWTQRSPEQQETIRLGEEALSESDTGLLSPRLIDPEEEEEIRLRVATTRWLPPFYHWRYWVPLGQWLGVVCRDGYGRLSWCRPFWTTVDYWQRRWANTEPQGWTPDMESVPTVQFPIVVEMDPRWEDRA